MAEKKRSQKVLNWQKNYKRNRETKKCTIDFNNFKQFLKVSAQGHFA